VLLKACAVAGDAERASRVLEWIAAGGLQYSKHTYASLIKIYTKAGYASELLQLVDHMEVHHFQPSWQLWRFFILACGNLGQLEAAFSVWQRQIRLGPLPTVQEYNCLIKACRACCQGLKAVEVLKAMQRAGHSPAVETYALVMAALQARTGQRVAKEQVLAGIEVKELMVASGLPPTVEVYSRLVALCAEVDDYGAVRKLVAEMQTRRLPLDSVCCTAVIKGYGAVGWVEEAYALYQRMRSGPKPMQPSRATHLALTALCRQAGRVDLALQCYQDMRGKGFAPCDAEFQALTAAMADQVVEGGGDGGALRSAIDMSGKSSPQVEGLAAGDITLDVSRLSTAEARAAVLGMLHSLQVQWRAGDLQVCGGVLVRSRAGRGGAATPEAEHLESTIRQLFASIKLQVAADPGGSGASFLPREALLDWLGRKQPPAAAGGADDRPALS